MGQTLFLGLNPSSSLNCRTLLQSCPCISVPLFFLSLPATIPNNLSVYVSVFLTAWNSLSNIEIRRTVLIRSRVQVARMPVPPALHVKCVGKTAGRCWLGLRRAGSQRECPLSQYKQNQMQLWGPALLVDLRKVVETIPRWQWREGLVSLPRAQRNSHPRAREPSAGRPVRLCTVREHT